MIAVLAASGACLLAGYILGLLDQYRRGCRSCEARYAVEAIPSDGIVDKDMGKKLWEARWGPAEFYRSNEFDHIPTMVHQKPGWRPGVPEAGA